VRALHGLQCFSPHSKDLRCEFQTLDRREICEKSRQPTRRPSALAAWRARPLDLSAARFNGEARATRSRPHYSTLGGYFPPSSGPPQAWDHRRFSRVCMPRPHLKYGKTFFSTDTATPLRGFRAVRAGRVLTEKMPKSRISTRSPRASAAMITSSMALTMFSTSRSRRRGFWSRIRLTSSDLSISAAPSLGPVRHQIEAGKGQAVKAGSIRSGASKTKKSPDMPGLS
jgi:hypothetical protein